MLDLKGGLLVQFSSILDGCDGEVARLKFMTTKKGGFIDSVLDRYGDSVIILGLCFGYWSLTGSVLVWVAGFGAVVGSIVFSYTNARHENMFHGKGSAGLPVRRDVRLFVIMLGALTAQVLAILVLLAIVTNVENIRRIVIVGSRGF
ncbi:MAG: CDP-alcohol phosphatidyltransferase family protein [Thermoplasmata archaeon]